jgi:recombination protein RecT
MPESTAVAVVEQPKAIALIRDELEKREGDLLAVLPPSMDLQRFMRVSLLAVSKNPDILKCTPGSIIRSIVEAAEVGLEPTGSLNRAWLVPFKDKDKPKPEAQLMIGYQGYADLMRDSGRVTRVTAEIVYDGDLFKVVKGSEEPRIEHEPAYQTEDPTKITYVYAVAWFADGTSQFEVLTRAQVEAIRAKSRQRNGPTWTQNWAQMARKTAIRRLANYVPLSARASAAIARDDEREYGTPSVSIAESRTATVRERIRARKAASEAPGAAEAPEPTDTPVPDGPGPQQPETDQSGDEAQVREICGATSDPALGAVEACVLPAGHLDENGAAQRHQAESGSIWPVEAPK